MAEIRLKSTGTIKLFENDNTSNVTIASPASLGADRTVTLPDGDVTLTTGTMPVLTGSTNNTVTTVTAANAISGETNLTFDGTDLTLGTGSVVFGTASHGVYLGVTTGTAANLLDDYEEGDWTPIVTTGGASPSYTTQNGRYVKIGRQVHVYMKLEYTSASGNTGQWGGLPFSCSNEVSGNMDQSTVIYDDRNTTTYMALFIANDDKFYIRAQGTMSGGLQTPSDFSGNKLYINGTYITT